MENQENQKSLVIARYVTEIIGSDLENRLWESCAAVQIKHYWSGELAPSSRFADAHLCWNEEALMVRFVGEQREPLNISAKPIVDRKTLGIWDRDVCEIFLAPDASHPEKYFEFEAAPSGEWVDLAIAITTAGRQTEWDYESGMKTVVQVNPEQIVVGISIPWSDRIPKPKAGDEWRANLFRCVGSDEANRYMAWRPTFTAEPNFHVPDAFGLLRFT